MLGVLARNANQTTRSVWALAWVLLLISLWPGTTAAQVSDEQAASMLLTSARRAFNEKNYTFAAARFQEFLNRFATHRDAPAARYGLALTLLEGPDRDYNRALEMLQPLAEKKDFPDYPHVLYGLGLAQRGLGLRELAQVDPRFREAPQNRSAGVGRFEEASKHFGSAATAFAERVKEVANDARELPLELEWFARARCDQAEMQLRVRKPKDAQATADLFVKHRDLVKSRYRNLGLYYHGFASFLLKDYTTAAQSLNRAVLYDDPVFGTHCRYLAARIHHLGEEAAAAVTHYEAVLTAHARQKKAAAAALLRPDRFRNEPEEKARLEQLARDPPPEHVARTTFYLGVLLYEGGKVADAQARLAAFAQQNPTAPLVAEAQLRLGFCLVQQRKYQEAIKLLQPLADREPRLADQALLWLGRAQVGLAELGKPQESEQALHSALQAFRRAADRAQQQSSTDPDSRARQAEILLELADTQLQTKQYREAARTYGQLLDDKALPQREEEILQRQATALHLVGEYAESDRLCELFLKKHPRSPLTPAILFRQAENAYFAALAAEKNAGATERAAQMAKLNDEVLQRYAIVVEKCPEFAYVNLARHGLAMAHYRKGDLEKALEVLRTIPDADRSGDLAVVSYLQADCLIRLASAKGEDALAAGKLEELLRTAGKLLGKYTTAQPQGPQTPDALLKLGYCHQRLAAQPSLKEEKARLLVSARSAYDRLLRQFPTSDLAPNAVLERARCQAHGGNVLHAVYELRRFTSEPLRSAAIAPMALLQMATYLRAQNKAGEAADVLAQARQQYEDSLRRDPARAGWFPLMQYHHGLALKEAGKHSEARNVLDQVLRQSAGQPEAAEAALRWGQSLKEDGLQKLAEARKILSRSYAKGEEVTAANLALQTALKDIRDAVQYLEAQAEQLRDRPQAAELRARLLYEAAWGSRALAEAEVTAAREALQRQRWQKQQEEAARKTPPGETPLAGPLPEVRLNEVPVQPAEQKVRSLYQAIIASFAEQPLASDARFELAELFSERSEHDSALKLLRERLDRETAPELTEKLRLRLGVCLSAKGDLKGALAQFTAVISSPKSAFRAQAHYRAGECLLAQGTPAEAVKHLTLFRDQGEYQNVSGVTDRALLRLGQALAQLKQWDESRQAHEQVSNRFGQSPWIHEARYGIGWACQNLGQFDNAVSAYNQVTGGTLAEIAAKAQLQIGLCRLEQKRYPEAALALLVVPFTYDYPELSAAALCEAARTFVALKQPDQAVRLLERVLHDHGSSPWAAVAKERLAGLKN
jgi:tetratricopeptide (TPR) repeat protein